MVRITPCHGVDPGSTPGTSVNLYRHKNCTDTAIEIVKKFYVKEKDMYKMKIRWWNVSRSGCHDPWCMNITQHIELSRTKWREGWELYATV